MVIKLLQLANQLATLEQVFELVNVLVIISFYANGIMAEGINEAELKAIADAKETIWKHRQKTVKTDEGMTKQTIQQMKTRDTDEEQTKKTTKKN